MVKKIIGGAAAALLLWLVWYYFFPSEEEKIRRQLHELAELVSKEAPESGVNMALKIRQIQDHLAPEIQVVLEEHERRYQFAPADISRPLIAFRNRYQQLQASFHDIEVTIADEQTQVAATCYLQVSSLEQPQPRNEAHLLQLTLSSGEERWLIHQVHLPPALSR